MSKKLGTESYKGVRDFYPREMFVEKYIFDVMRKTAESFGYAEYGASILEPAELYRSKTSDEIVNEQMYTFLDRGDREVALRPEMTPSLARMVAAKKRELNFPLRWYSIPNLFRYERPQRGRLREHWQLNVDIFGVDSTDADAEVISIADQVLRNFGLVQKDYTIKINFAGMLSRFIVSEVECDQQTSARLIQLIDRLGKINDSEIDRRFKEILTDSDKRRTLLKFLKDKDRVREKLRGDRDMARCLELKGALEKQGIAVELDPFLTRGFDYYTGIIFEVFDNNPKNNRALFGGGRYDNLLELFGNDKMPAVGFGMGDVTMRDVLETYGLLPAYRPTTDLFLCTLEKGHAAHAAALAQELRAQGVNVAVNMEDRKLGEQIRKASKEDIPFVICIGDSEVAGPSYKLKDLETGDEVTVDKKSLAKKILDEKL